MGTGRKPLVGLPSCVRTIGEHVHNIAGEKYIAAVAVAADATPMILPSLLAPVDPGAFLDAIDGLLITGSPSNVEPSQYGGEAPRDITLLDPQRDHNTLPLIRAAIERGTPMLAICRGCQELNVAMGGTLFQHTNEEPGRMDHLGSTDRPLAEKYGRAHTVSLAPDGLLATITGEASIMVNSIHNQGIDRPGERLSIEATAQDGQIEAVSVNDSPRFALGVQWHPEWEVMGDEPSRKIFAAFGAALRS